MKKCVVFIMVVLMSLTHSTALAAPRPIDIGAVLQMSEPALVSAYGSPARIEPSEYGFRWYIYNKSLTRFMMVGVMSGRVVAAYTNSKGMKYGAAFGFGSRRSAVRGKLGDPVHSVQNSAGMWALPFCDKRDHFKVGNRLVIVFYDDFTGGGASSVMAVPYDLETKIMGNQSASPADMVASYVRISADLVNSARVLMGRAPLGINVRLSSFALSRSSDMITRRYFSHYTPDGISCIDLARKSGIRFGRMGENIAFGNHNAMLAHESFMASAGHRKNLLNPNYRKIGVGVSVGRPYSVMLAEEFTD